MSSGLKTQRIALIHDWLNSYRGGERMLEALCELYPAAEIFTLFHVKGSTGKIIEGHPIHPSFLNHLPGNRKYYRHLLPLFPFAIERLDLSPFDLVISSSHCVAKGVIVRPDALHVSYCYTPMRYAWDKYRDYFSGKWYEPFFYPFLFRMRIWDVTSSARVDHFVGISQWVRRRIQKYYRRDATVIYPFVDLETFHPTDVPKKGDYYLVVSAFAPYKRIDLAIEACKQMDRELWVVGEGQVSSQLKKMAGVKTRFLGRTSNEELMKAYQNCRALLFPGEEDFGIVPLEAMACGRPVIAHRSGGCLETVLDGKTGLFFDEFSSESLGEAIDRFEKTENQYLPGICRGQAENFSKKRFQDEFLKTIESLKEKTQAGELLL